MADRLPVVFLPHGGGPWPFVKTPFGSPQELAEMRSYIESVGKIAKPKALLVISAHWEEQVPSVMSGERPPMLYDYYGFPAESYKLNWPAPGEPKLAARVRKLMEGAGFQTGEDRARGFDHGTFVPMMLAFPGADIPTVQLSLIAGLNPEQHIRLGRALAPLRDEGVLIIGSGMTFHNLRAFGDPRSGPISEEFDAWLRDAGTRPAKERDALLAAWEKAPAARLVHPREEHLLPLMVVAGAAGEDQGRIPYNGTVMGARISAYHFG
jgi:aromatic ring-opening dioxygenase catalytic subunit (LigB family)